MFFGSKNLLGLDIGTSTIKLADVEVGRSGVSLNAFAITQTPPNSVVAGDIIDTAAVAQAISSMLESFPAKRRAAATGLWGSSVIVKKISIPRMDEKVVGEQIRWEAEQYIPFDINEVNLAYTILRGAQQSAETMDILIIAARQEHTMKYAETVEGAGLQCATLDVGGFALANCFEANYQVSPGQPTALLNVGASVSNLVVVDGGDVVFCRDIPVGGLTYSSEVQKALSISLEEAENMKLSVSSGQAAPEEAIAAIRTAHELVCDEIQGSFDFFANTNAASGIQRCFLTGGSAKMTGLKENLARVTNVNVEAFDPFARVGIKAKSNISPAYVADIREFAAVAVGLGMRKAGDA